MTETALVPSDPVRTAPQFFCDAMLGGLSRWLRASGYEAAFEHGIDDGVLVARTGAAGGVLLSSDAPLFERRLVRTGAVRGLFVPRHAPVLDQTAFVLRALGLPLREVRCMRCGGALCEIARAEAERAAPPGALRACERFWRCAGCAGLFWHGTHWARIEAARTEIARRVAYPVG